MNEHGDGPVLIEHNSDDSGAEWETQWFCYPPPPEMHFRVTREEWNADRTVRRIYAVSRD